MLDYLRQLNPSIKLFKYNDEEFLQYGKIITHYDFSNYMDIMKNRSIPETGNIYEALDPELTAADPSGNISLAFYGNMPIQAGYCNGTSSNLNALEYHKGSEIDIAVTNLVLLLADLRDIKANTLSSSCVKGFYFPAGTACELYGTTLHFAPCKLDDKGYKSIIILPKGTNSQLTDFPAASCPEDELLWMQNKWLIAHPDSKPAALGAWAGITGNNIEVKYK